MNISFKQARDDYYLFSGKVSDLCRQLNFAAIAVIWILKADPTKSGGISWVNALLWPLTLAVLGLVFDLVQYVWQTAVWGVFQTMTGKTIRELKDKNQIVPATFPISDKVNVPSLLLFWLKLVFTGLAYVFLLTYMFGFLKK